MILCEPTDHALKLLSNEAPLVELGSGDGRWLRAMLDYGIDVIGFDLYPRSPDVRQGSMDSANEHADRTLLMIWPPDRSNWLEEWNGNRAIFIGNPDRYRFKWKGERMWILPGGPKGRSDMVLYERP